MVGSAIFSEGGRTTITTATTRIETPSAIFVESGPEEKNTRQDHFVTYLKGWYLQKQNVDFLHQNQHLR
jgi:hypothetical protein